MASILHILGLTRDGFLERIIYCLVTISSARVRDITLILHFRVEVFGDIDVVMSGEDVDVYEQLPEGVSLFTTAFAGAAAGSRARVTSCLGARQLGCSGGDGGACARMRVVCPMKCGPEEMMCPGGTDPMGCPMGETCIPAKGEY